MFSQYWVLELLVSDILIPYIAVFLVHLLTNLKSDFRANLLTRLVRFIAWKILHFSSILSPLLSYFVLIWKTCTTRYQSWKKKTIHFCIIPPPRYCIIYNASLSQIPVNTWLWQGTLSSSANQRLKFCLFLEEGKIGQKKYR